jgi:hypothetical protein
MIAPRDRHRRQQRQQRQYHADSEDAVGPARWRLLQQWFTRSRQHLPVKNNYHEKRTLQSRRSNSASDRQGPERQKLSDSERCPRHLIIAGTAAEIFRSRLCDARSCLQPSLITLLQDCRTGCPRWCLRTAPAIAARPGDPVPDPGGDDGGVGFCGHVGDRAPDPAPGAEASPAGVLAYGSSTGCASMRLPKESASPRCLLPG